DMERVRTLIRKSDKHQLKRSKKEKHTSRSSLLYLEMLTEYEEIVYHAESILRQCRKCHNGPEDFGDGRPEPAVSRSARDVPVSKVKDVLAPNPDVRSSSPPAENASDISGDSGDDVSDATDDKRDEAGEGDKGDTTPPDSDAGPETDPRN
ncbi:MAG: hypothetical protein KFH87_03440, partial [Bacteroidetes bacterium]|nr:hypothetical protein [Bacteroidota bacterium]